MSTSPEPSGEKADPLSDQGPALDAPKAPRWVKVPAVIVGVLVLPALIVKLTGLGGEHGPGRHTGSSPAVSVTTGQPADGGEV